MGERELESANEIEASDEKERSAGKESGSPGSQGSAPGGDGAGAGEPDGGAKGGEPGEGDEGAAEPEPEALKERLALAEAELARTAGLLAQAEDRYLRLRAEFDNFRKRTRQEIEEIRARAAESLAGALLPVVDNLERALAAASGGSDPKALTGGVELVLRQFLQELAKAGVTPIAAVGAPFDPNVHEAIAFEESDEHPEGMVLEEFQKGYILNGKVLRPSMVKVAKARGASGGNEE